MNNETQNTPTKPASVTTVKGSIFNTLQMIRYNLKIIFGNRFIYFLLSAIGLFIFIVVVNLFKNNSISEADIYQILILTGALLLFYPTAFGIQSDKDARTLEIIFGIPDYRYRVWLMRILLIYILVFVVLFVLAELLNYVLVTFPVLNMVVQVFFPLTFLGLFTFYLSTIIRSGNGTAAVIIVLGILLMILSANIEKSYWNVFFNPFDKPSGSSEIVWQSLTFKNRIFLSSGSILFLLGGLMNLQKREKFLN